MSYRWPPRYVALKSAHKARNQYLCAKCEKIFTKKEIAIDHVVPVTDPIQGFTGWQDYVERMFPDYGGYQVLCQATCHSKKTKRENKLRVKTKRKAKQN